MFPHDDWRWQETLLVPKKQDIFAQGDADASLLRSKEVLPQTVVTKISQETLAENARVPICHE